MLHLEYCIKVLSSYRKKDILVIRLKEYRGEQLKTFLYDYNSYEERLKECGLKNLETRRLREDQIEVFKILIGYENIERNIIFFTQER